MPELEKSEIKQVVSLHLPFKTIVTVLAVILLLVCLKVLAPLLMILFLSNLVAVSLSPVLLWLEKKRFKRSLAIALIAFALTAVIVGIGIAVLPRLFDELSNFIANLPKIKEQILDALSPSNPIRPLIEQGLNKQAVVPKATDIAPIFSAGNIAMGGLTEIVLIFVFSIYLLVDGQGIILWLSAFFNLETQEKIHKTIEEVFPIIFSYVSGQLITSFVCFAYVLIALSCLHVPSALLLATLSAIFDILPVLGFFLAVIPTVVFALSVSGSTAIFAVGLYVLYHILENYFIVPAVYGKRLRVSSFVVLVTLIAAGLLAGIEGAVAALPIVASYPIIERIWLKKFVGKSTIAEHKAQDTSS